MRYEFLDPKRTILKIKITDLDDLWVLHSILRPGDLATMRTMREVKSGESGEGGRRLPMILTLKVIKTEFQPFTNKLRIRGVVVEGPDKYGIQGQHHTFSVGIGDELVVERSDGWPRYVSRMLEEARKYHGCILIVAIDYDEIGLGAYRIQGLHKIMEEELRLPGKQDESREAVIQRTLAEKSRLIRSTAERLNCQAVIVGGPGFLKNKLYRVIREFLSGRKVLLENASMGGWSGVREIVRRGLPERLLSEERLAAAQLVLEEALRLVSQEQDRAGFGIEECMRGAEQSAVQDILVTDEMLTSIDEDTRKKLDKLLGMVYEKGGRIHVVPVNSPVGELLLGMGGVACTYRFRVYTE